MNKLILSKNYINRDRWMRDERENFKLVLTYQFISCDNNPEVEGRKNLHKFKLLQSTLCLPSLANFDRL